MHGRILQAIILAAGMGKRLKELTKDCTKTMVKVNGITLIERMLKQLDYFCTITVSQLLVFNAGILFKLFF